MLWGCICKFNISSLRRRRSISLRTIPYSWKLPGQKFSRNTESEIIEIFQAVDPVVPRREVSPPKKEGNLTSKWWNSWKFLKRTRAWDEAAVSSFRYLSARTESLFLLGRQYWLFRYVLSVSPCERSTYYFSTSRILSRKSTVLRTLRNWRCIRYKLAKLKRKLYLYYVCIWGTHKTVFSWDSNPSSPFGISTRTIPTQSFPFQLR